MSITLNSEKEFAKWSNSKRAFQAGNPYSKAQRYKSCSWYYYWCVKLEVDSKERKLSLEVMDQIMKSLIQEKKLDFILQTVENH